MTRRPSQSADEATGRALLALIVLEGSARAILADLKLAGAPLGAWVDILNAAIDGQHEIRADATARLVLAAIADPRHMTPAEAAAVAGALG